MSSRCNKKHIQDKIKNIYLVMLIYEVVPKKSKTHTTDFCQQQIFEFWTDTILGVGIHLELEVL